MTVKGGAVENEGSVTLRRGRSGRARRWLRSHRTLRESDIVQFVLLLAVALVVAVIVLADPREVPSVAFAPIIVLAGLFLSVPRIVVVYAPIAAVILISLVLYRPVSDTYFVTPISLAGIMVFMFLLGRSRARIGTQGFHGDNLLVDLRDRIQRNGALPDLPEGWLAESALSRRTVTRSRGTSWSPRSARTRRGWRSPSST